MLDTQKKYISKAKYNKRKSEMFACQKQNNKEHYKKSKLYCKLRNNILENYRMLESTSFFVGFSVLYYVYFGTIKHS